MVVTAPKISPKFVDNFLSYSTDRQDNEHNAIERTKK